MDENTAKVLLDLIESVRDLSFDVNFCLEMLKQDEEIANFYAKCKQKFEEEITKKIEGDE